MRDTAIVLIAIASVAGCSSGEKPASAAQEFEYPAPKYLRTLVKPSDAQLLDAARIVVRQPYGMPALGKAQAGWTVHVFLPVGQDMKTFNAIQQAWAERDVKAIAVQPWEVTGETEADFMGRVNEGRAVLRGNEGYKETAHFDPAYYPYLPADVAKETGHPVYGVGLSAFPALGKYLDAHAEVEHFFFAPGGGVEFFCQAIPPHCGKAVGNWIYLNAIDITNHGLEYPGDLWNLVEEVIAKPAPSVSEGQITDPQGTDVRWTMTAAQARNWATYVKTPAANNHLFLYPNAPDTQTIQGVVAGTANHVGFMPMMKVHLSEHGRPLKVEGGGRHGDLVRTLFESPKLNNLSNGDPVCFPGLPECGYWFLTSDGYGTNPKKVRNYETLINGSTDLANVWERERAGVLHMSFAGVNPFAVKPAAVKEALKTGSKVSYFNADPAIYDYAYSNNLPVGHTAHMHLYFPTIRWRMRDTGEWITVSDKGRPTAYDNPEVRALASKYGDPETIFSYDWIPGLPGINMPGDAAAYDKDPWRWIVQEWEEMKNGTYRYFVPDYKLTKVAAADQ